MFKVNSKDTRTYLIPWSSVSIVNFEQLNTGWDKIHSKYLAKSQFRRNFLRALKFSA